MLGVHDTDVELLCAVDLVNSGKDEEQLADLDALGDFVTRHRVSDVTRLTQEDLLAVHRLRERIQPLFDTSDDEAAAKIVNTLLAQAPVIPRMTSHDDHPWHLHYSYPGASLADHLAVDLGMAFGRIIASGQRERLRRCAAPGCRRVLVDMSRNRSRRYCDARTCGNRLHVAAYRQRRRAEAG